ncbi:MAG: 50S ribosomal protein L9 [Coriobacteriales bacterium]|jgi:large subunit ribosomal protein L9|nr:50S ribosomal protein L9 [Coriobacteriales bacterium]
MKVILLSELKGKGGEGDVVEVATGYAVNFLLPRKIAIPATAGNLKQLEQRKHNIAKRETNRLDTADKIVAALEGQTIRLGAKVGEEGQLFGSITPIQVADAINARFNIEVDRRRIDLHKLIKTVGEHPATVSIYRDIKATITIEVVDEKTLKAAEDSAAKVVAESETSAVAEAEAAEVVEAEVAVVEVAAAEVVAAAAIDEAVEAEAEVAAAATDEVEAEAITENEAAVLGEIQDKIEDAARTLAAAADATEGEDAIVAEAAVEVLQDIEGAIDAAVADAVETEVEEKLAEALASENEKDTESNSE